MPSLPRFFSVSPIFCSFCFIRPYFSFLSWAHLPVLRGFRFLTLRLTLQLARCAIRGYSNRSTPSKTLDTACNALKTGDFPTVYNQYSSSYQSQLGGEASWEAATKQGVSSQGGVVNCTYSTVNDNGSAGSDVMSLTFGYGVVETFQQTLIVENGVWKINSSTRLT